MIIFLIKIFVLKLGRRRGKETLWILLVFVFLCIDTRGFSFCVWGWLSFSSLNLFLSSWSFCCCYCCCCCSCCCSSSSSSFLLVLFLIQQKLCKPIIYFIGPSVTVPLWTLLYHIASENSSSLLICGSHTQCMLTPLPAVLLPASCAH